MDNESIKKLLEKIMKKLTLPLTIFFCGLILIIVFNIIGSKVKANGSVVEPFFLIPIGSLLLFVGFIWSLIALLKFFVNKKNNT